MVCRLLGITIKKIFVKDPDTIIGICADGGTFLLVLFDEFNRHFYSLFPRTGIVILKIPSKHIQRIDSFISELFLFYFHIIDFLIGLICFISLVIIVGIYRSIFILIIMF